ncbi:hypothetical protein Tco_1007058, partial [Tanacetum coccineum]
MGGIFSIKARDMDTKLLSAPESNNTLARKHNSQHNIRPEGFLSSVLLWLVITVAVVGVGVTVVVVVESSSVSDGKIRLPSSGPQFGTLLLYQKLLEFNP